MKRALFGARHDRLQSRRIQQPICVSLDPLRTREQREDEPKDVETRFESGRADNRNSLREHDLIPSVSVQIQRAEEAGLRRMRVNPSEREEISLRLIEESFFFVC